MAPSDTVVRYWSDTTHDEHCIRFGDDAQLDGGGVVDLLSQHLPAVAADLLDFAASVYAIDRMVRRPSYFGYDNGGDWARKLKAVFPVRDPDRWTQAQNEVHALLEWLTDDLWECTFVPTAGSGLRSGQNYLLSVLPNGIEPILFSGGMDSSAGLAVHGQTQPLLPVSVVTNNHMTKVQRDVLDRLPGIATESRHVRFRVNLSRRLTGPSGQIEQTQRSRGLVFLAAGAATALTLGVDRLWFCENGVGAVNLPYIRSQLGAQATRSAHPRTTAGMEALLRKLTGTRFTIHNPLLRMTKAEVISAVPSEFTAAMAASVSCDTSFASRVKGHPRCGVCTSCLLRRQAVASSRYPQLDERLVYREKVSAGTEQLVAMLWQASRMSDALRSDAPWPALAGEFPTILEAARYIPNDALTSMFTTYTREWPLFMDSLGLRVDEWFGQDGDRTNDGHHSG
ncbi:7-cyano-7-deazaguanine synthase [Amycolatopsis sp. NPDC004625]|uniref:7-cyano-7-deazaguanine synthase n=1 Tax=Amycolatopsis sp. NPDC004625 TaxID=3154670 RepID=UPI0033B551EE